MKGLSISVNMFLGGKGARGRCVGYKLNMLASSNMVLGVVYWVGRVWSPLGFLEQCKFYDAVRKTMK